MYTDLVHYSEYINYYTMVMLFLCMHACMHYTVHSKDTLSSVSNKSNIFTERLS